ncbi:YihY/virulence factor BrkB family protein [Streptomyces sp. NBC_01216]|uniref:YihY/virulence factor BrkB family protein n=1 Tax=unclassified Streptomyces TaxID=2593676 RepID=UPI002E138F4F|nr:YihY/virulence factor BrkB family protein [Streptomyces sp. NBC_01216]
MTTPGTRLVHRAARRARAARSAAVHSVRAVCRSAARRWPALRATPVALWRDDVADWAAALTYYAILALVPALLVAVTLTGLVSPDGTDRLIVLVSSWAPAESGATLRETLRELAAERSAAWVLIAAGTVSSLWSASSHLAVFRRALHAMHRVEDRRPALHTAPLIVLNAALLLALLVTSAGVLVFTEPVARAVEGLLGVHVMSARAWTLLRWLGLLTLVTLLVLVLFRTGPAVAKTRAHAAPGAALAVLLWLTGSAAFSLYATSFGTYSRLYGSLAGVVVFLVWLWSSHLSLLAGAQFAAESARVTGRPREDAGDPVRTGEPDPATERAAVPAGKRAAEQAEER